MLVKISRYTVSDMSPAPSGSLALQRVKLSNALEIRNGIDCNIWKLRIALQR